ncbi:accessory factor UbiK family protein [Spartinivicinus ruber]|uniref:accessory factor UbiK family protein n=1 Tax=Spartinivicinus ruber TaxID=2683272 RepID=UPI0013D6A12E|nr:accessory factor UbiK family protein [Spartinivicinus ruber]
MINKDFIQSLSEQIGQTITSKAQSFLQGDKTHLQTELENHIKLLLQSAFNRLDLVTRDEFDNQTAVLQRTREKVDLLSKQVALLEQALSATNNIQPEQITKQVDKEVKDEAM